MARCWSSVSTLSARISGRSLPPPIQICEARDPKGLYRLARIGKLPNLTGIGSAYEAPEHPELVLDCRLSSRYSRNTGHWFRKVLNRDRARFEVAGGNYRLIASFDFRRQIVFVKFSGIHAEYDAIDALTVARF
jgi:adenylylsulfate kinase/RelE-like HigB toxin of type II HigAB toxin-antitoxin system